MISAAAAESIVAAACSPRRGDAAVFVAEAVKAEMSRLAEPRHLTPVEVVLAVRTYAVVRMGPLAGLALRHLGLRDNDALFDAIETCSKARVLALGDGDSRLCYLGLMPLLDGLEEIAWALLAEAPVE